MMKAGQAGLWAESMSLVLDCLSGIAQGPVPSSFLTCTVEEAAQASATTLEIKL